MLKIISAKNPIYSNLEKTQINLNVIFEEFDGQELPFMADKNDIYPHGVELFNRSEAGEFGIVEPYTPPAKELPA